MNTGRQALENIGVIVNKYYSSEIKTYAIELTQYHFPDTIQVGDVTKWKEWDINWGSIDLVLSGSPCQDLSIAGKREGINGKKSSLFFVFIDILEHIKSLNKNVFFLQENVGSASKLDVGIMSRALGVYPVRINSSLVTAQLRDRYYWSNLKTKKTIFDLVTDIPQPLDRKIMLKDIITSGYVDVNKSSCVMEGWSRPNNENEFFKIYKRHKKQFLTGVYFDESFEYKKGFRILNKIEMCRLQGFNDNYTEILSRNDSASLLGDGWTLPVIEHILSFSKFVTNIE
jgi:site-specific DNA-cytosine methylase